MIKLLLNSSFPLSTLIAVDFLNNVAIFPIAILSKFSYFYPSYIQ